MFNAAKNFVNEHKDTITQIAPYAALVIGAIILYSKSFDYGYNCRVNLEKAAGETIFNAVEKLN